MLVQVRKLTQEEMLEEAKWTEVENLASLEAYAKMEAEKKKVKEKKVVWTGPVVRYLSLTMPVLEVEDADNAETGEVEGVQRAGGGDLLPDGGRSSDGENKGAGVDPADGVAMETDSADKGAESAPRDRESEAATPTPSGAATTTTTSETDPEPHPPPPPSPPAPEARQSRNFMVFTDTNNFPSAYFPPAPTRPPRPRRRFCPVTGLPAKYIDPLTRTPYATPFAFKVIRMRYVSEAEEKCERRLIQLSNWLEEKKKKKMESV